MIWPVIPPLRASSRRTASRPAVSQGSCSGRPRTKAARNPHRYGQGSYRIPVAEAGHTFQMLVLAATALGLSVRPFGGVFEDLINKDLGLDTSPY